MSRSTNLLLALCTVFFVQAMPLLSSEALLKADISLVQGENKDEKQNKFQPVFPVQISALIKNTGPEASDPMQVSVRYAFPQPYHQIINSVIFETDEIDLPALQPGEEKLIQFKKPQSLPTIDDFVRHDWAMRQYQAIIKAKGQEKIIGTLALTYSAYYYPIKTKN